MREIEREQLKQELERRAQEALGKLDPQLRKCMVKDLLRRFLIAKTMKGMIENGVSSKTDKVFKAPSQRRITRSMARTSAIQQNETGNTGKASDAGNKSSFIVPSTPKISPFLPETPAALRKQKQHTGSTKKIKGKENEDRRIMGSMISTSANAPEPILKMQLNDGTVVDVNLAADPSKIRMSLGEGMFGEVKRFLSNITKYAVNW